MAEISVIRGTDVRIFVQFKEKGAFRNCDGYSSAIAYITIGMNAPATLTKTLIPDTLSVGLFYFDLVPADTETKEPRRYVFEAKIVLDSKLSRSKQPNYLTIDERAVA